LGGLTNFIINLFLKITGLSFFNRVGGFFIGAIKAVLIITIFVTIGSNMDISKKYFEDKGKNSKFYNKFLILGKKIMYNIEEIQQKTKNNSTVIEKKASSISKKIIHNEKISKITKVLSDKDKRNKVVNEIREQVNDGLEIISK
jgi:uncharacterized membrane protein required for colicin V production